MSLRVLLIGSDNSWRTEAAVQRALRRHGHTTLLIDDGRMKRRVGRSLTQRWARWQTNSANHTYDQRVHNLLENLVFANPL